MANKVKTTKQLKLIAGFADGDDRTIAFDTVRDDITGTEVKALESKAAAGLIGDKAGAAFTGWKSAQIVTTKTTYVDIS